MCLELKNKSKTLRSVILLGAISLGSVNSSLAQNAAGRSTLEEIIVTASKRGSVSVQDSSFSVQAFSEQTLEKMGIEEFTDFSRSVPGLDVVDLGPAQKTYVIRGVSGAGESTVGVYVDNIPMVGAGTDARRTGGNQPDLGAFDMSRIEVLRGPQGTLYGASSVSGVVRMVTNKPDVREFSGRLQVDGSTIAHGSSATSVKGMVNVPLAEDKLALRLVGYYRDFGGFVDNAVLGRDPSCYVRGTDNQGSPGTPLPEVSLDYSNPACTAGIAAGQEDINSYTNKGLRAQLGWEISDSSSLIAQYFKQEIDMDGRTASNPYDSLYVIGPPFVTGTPTFFTPAAGELVTNVRSQEPHLDDIDIFGLEYEKDFDKYSLTVALNRLERDIVDYRDSSSPARLANRFNSTPLGPWAGATISRSDRVTSFTEQDVEQTTLEARIASKFDGRFNFIAGVFSQELDTSLSSLVFETDPVTGLVFDDSLQLLNRTAGVDQSSSAFFGEAYFDVTDEIQLMGGLRYFDIDRDQRSFLVVPFVQSEAIGGAAGDQPSISKSFDDTTYKFQLTYRPTEDMQLYAQYAEGFRAGGVNAQVVPSIPPSFDPDTAKSTELGFKSSWLEDRLFANFSVYSIDWENTQIGASFTTQFAGLVNCTEQGNPVTSEGWEAELVYQLTDHIEVGANYSSLDAVWNVDPESCLTPELLATLSDPLGGGAGQKLIGVPDDSGSVYFDYSFNWKPEVPGYLRLDWVYQGEVDVNQAREERNIANPSYNMGNLKVGASFGSLDFAVYVKNLTDEVAYLSMFNDFQQENRVTPSQPRTLGLTVDYRF